MTTLLTGWTTPDGWKVLKHDTRTGNLLASRNGIRRVGKIEGCTITEDSRFYDESEASNTYEYRVRNPR